MVHIKSAVAVLLLAALGAGCSGSATGSAAVPSAGSPSTASTHAAPRDGDTLGGVGDRPAPYGMAEAAPASGVTLANPTISGVVENTSGAAVTGAKVVAVGAFGLTASAQTDASGSFVLTVSSPGTYQLYVYNGQASGNTNSSAKVAGPSVTVQAGQTAFVGIITD